MKIGSNLSEEQRERLINFLREHHDVFAWSHSNMSGISPSLSCHKLNVSLHHKPIKQKRRTFNQERYDAIEQEVDRLLAPGFIREVVYPDWVSNVVLVKKSNRKWLICVDFIDLNKSCPKDSFPLPQVDQLVDATAGHDMLSFMDTFSGYNQIPMYEPDQDITAFITNCELYCYKVMPFGLKNAIATYQRLLNKIFKEQIGHTMEVYIDDMITKSIHAGERLGHLRDTFMVLRRHQMRLNPKKCAFGVTSGKFLGFMVQQRGIEANTDKICTVLDMKWPCTIKEVQSLAGRVAALSRFISKATDWCKPFFKALKAESFPRTEGVPRQCSTTCQI